MRHIIAESFGERADVRGKLRKILHKTAKLICSRIDPARREAADAAALPESAQPAAALPESEAVDGPHSVDSEEADEPFDAVAESLPDEHDVPDEQDVSDEHDVPDDTTCRCTTRSMGRTRWMNHASSNSSQQRDSTRSATRSAARASTKRLSSTTSTHGPRMRNSRAGDAFLAAEPDVESPAAPPAEEVVVAAVGRGRRVGVGSRRGDRRAKSGNQVPNPRRHPLPPAVHRRSALPAMSLVTRKVMAKKQAAQSAAAAKKEKKRQRMEAAFKDYFSFQESISRIPPHRILAINRGERARILRVKMEADTKAMGEEAEKQLIPEGHPHAEFLRGCVRDALQRLILPRLDRELRRELAETAEEHAVEVFARNLRKLLLQPPVRDHRVLAVDPGFRSGCKLIALDEFGNVLGHEIIHVIGREDWIRAGRGKIVDLDSPPPSHRDRHRKWSWLPRDRAVGRGRDGERTERRRSGLRHRQRGGGQRLFHQSRLVAKNCPATTPCCAARFRSVAACSIPLSELVKINPANIGVGMYQHDVKAKHLRNSLDAVVESCVNYVGVDVNTASPALLRYVSGMNQLTARRLCEYRAKHGPFRSRDQLKQVSGLGEATFVQAAGFLKIANGDNPLDATWIHPESYELARRVLERAGCSLAELGESLPPVVVPLPAPAATTSWVLPDELPAAVADRGDR